MDDVNLWDIEVRKDEAGRLIAYYRGEILGVVLSTADLLNPEDIEVREYRPGRFAVYYRGKWIGAVTQRQVTTAMTELIDWWYLQWARVWSGRPTFFCTVVALVLAIVILGSFCMAWEFTQRQGATNEFWSSLFLNLGTELCGAVVVFVIFTMLWRLVQLDQQKIEKRMHNLLELRERVKEGETSQSDEGEV